MAELEIGSQVGKDAFRQAYADAETQAATDAGLVDESPAPEPVVEVAPVVEEAPAAAETPDERDARIAALEAQLAAKESFIGRQASEIGELRSTVEERFASYDERLNQRPARQITPDLIEQNPAAAAQLAYEQGDQATLGAAYQQWSLEDPAAAATWVGERRADERERALRAEFDERQKAFEARLAPIQQQQEQAVLTQSIQAQPEDVRAFLADATTVQALATEFPSLGAAIVNGSPSEKLNAIQALHGIHRGRTADTLNQAVTDVARTTAQEAQAVRDEAYVASSTASEAESLTYEQQEQQHLRDHALKRATPFGGGLVIPGK